MTRSPPPPAPPPARRSIWPIAILSAAITVVAALLFATLLSEDEGPDSTAVAEAVTTSYTIDPSLTVGRVGIPGLDGGPDRPVAAVVSPDGTREEFVENEVTLHTTDAAVLQQFLDRYGGEVLRTSDPIALDGSRQPAEDDLAGWYLIGIDPDRASLEDLDTQLDAIGPGGTWRFSSEMAARLVALAAGEPGLDIALNPVADLPSCTVCEQPVTGGGNLDAATWWWMAEDSGLSVGIVHAWEYLRYQGFPPTTAYFPVMVAVVDSGFDLDEATGMPLYGAADYGDARPRQIDLIDGDLTAGGLALGFANHPEGAWHGQETFGVCCANGRNLYGAAGTSGGITAGARVETLLLRVGPDTWTIAAAIHTALHNNAEVVVANVNLKCGWVCRWFDDGNYLKAVTQGAPAHGAVVVAPSGNAPSGNHGVDIGDDDMYPCQLAGVVCVGAIEWDGHPWDGSNWGRPVDIWAPTGILSAVTRGSANREGDTDDLDADELAVMGGTSCSAPYVAGVVALMMALDPLVADVESILIATANPATDPKVANGYVDAYQALAAVKPNRPPTVTITQPAEGSSVSREGVTLRAIVDDPEKSGPWGGEFESTITFVSDRDGTLCSAQGVHPDLGCLAPMLSLGEHRITATATDAFDATATATITVNVVDNPPTAAITYPADGARHPPTDVNLIGYGFDPDEEIPDGALSWSSDIDGHLGTGPSLWVALSPGTHTITLTATDSQGIAATASIQITVFSADGYPTVMISAPPHNTLVAPGVPVILEGIATDPEDGTITGRNLTWTSDVDGLLGTGSRLEIILSGLSCTSTVHAITLEAVDQDGHHGSHTITIIVVRLC